MQRNEDISRINILIGTDISRKNNLVELNSGSKCVTNVQIKSDVWFVVKSFHDCQREEETNRIPSIKWGGLSNGVWSRFVQGEQHDLEALTLILTGSEIKSSARGGADSAPP